MNYFKKLVGERIYLSPKGNSEEELQKYTEWMNDFQVTDYILQSSEARTLSTEKEYLDKIALNTDDSRAFEIVTLEENKLIGTVSLDNINWINRTADFGIFIGDKDYRNNGYGTEAIRLILEYGFKYLNLHNVKLELLSANERAHKCYLKCGFKDTGKRRETLFVNGKYYDELTMDILENEFNGDFIKNKNVK